MRTVVCAYSAVGHACLTELLELGADVRLVVTHSDAPGEEIWFDSVAELARLYVEQLATVQLVKHLGRAPYPHEHAWHIMVVVLDDSALSLNRDSFIHALREAGVGAGLHFVPLHLQSLYRPLVEHPETLSVATAANQRILTLPLFPEMAESDVAFVVDTLRKIVGKYSR